MGSRGNINEQKRVCYLVWLIIQYNQISVADVESWQMIAGIFGIEYIFIYNVSSTSCLVSVTPGKKIGFCYVLQITFDENNE